MPWWFGPALIINVALGLAFAIFLGYQEREFQSKATLVQLQAFVYGLNSDQIRDLTANAPSPEAAQEATQMLHRAFAVIQRSNPSIVRCQLLRDTGSHLKWILSVPSDSATSGVQITRALDDVPADIWSAIDGRHPIVSKSLLYPKFFGRTAYVPVLDTPRDKVLVTAAFDIDTFHWYPRILLAAGLPLLIMFLVFLLLFGSGLYVRRISEALDRADENRQRLQDIAASSADWIWETNAAGQFTYSSGQVVSLLGCPADAVLGRTLVDFLTFEESIRLGGFLAGVFALGEPISELECRVAGAHGREVIIQVAGVPVRDSEGGVAGYRGVARNVTERRRDEERLRHLSRAIDATAEAVIVTDRLGHILTVNPAFTRTTGYTMHEAIGSKPSLLRSGRHDTDFYSDMWQTIRAQRVWQGTVENRRKDGSMYRAALTISPVLDEHGRHEGYVGVHRDVTAEYEASQSLIKYNEDLRQAKLAAEEATRAKSEFLANMSHEIRTPLNAVIGMADLLFETDLMPEQREYTDVIRNGGESLLAVINDVLDFSKIEAGRMEFESRPFDVRAAVESVGDLLSATAFKKGLELVVSVEPEVPTQVLGDVVRLRQVLTNLTNNGIKFTHAGQVLVRCEVENLSDTEAALKFSVTDTGIGISPDAANRLFQSFSQVDASTTRKFGGTGLGLAISKRLVEGMGGTGIDLDSELGKGSTFHFQLTLPIVQGVAINEHNPTAPDDIFRDARILVIVENAPTRDMIQRLLAHWGCSSQSASNAQDARDLLLQSTQHPFRAALCDMDVWANASTPVQTDIRQLAAKYHSALIMLSPMPDLSNVDASQTRGFEKVLTKPIKQSHLYNALNDCLQDDRVPGQIPARKTSDTPFEVKAIEDARIPTDCKILIVDDNRINQLVAQRLLQKLGFDGEIVDNGTDALAQLQSGVEWDLVFMDCVLPDISGEDVTRRYRESEKVTGRHVSIVAMTAEAGDDHRRICLEAGMDDYLSKPIQLHDISTILKKYVKTKPVPIV